MEKYTYLLLNLFTISIPLALSFESKVQYFRKWKHLFPAILFTAIGFLIWDFYKTKFGVWHFNDAYTIGIQFFGLPIEEYLFFITVPYSCLFIYEVVNYYVRKTYFSTHTHAFLWLLSVASLIASFFFLNKSYTWSVLFGVAFLLPILMLLLNGIQLQNFFIMFCISILPMLVVNGLLTALPVVIYNNAENTGLRFTTMPVEDLLYNLMMLGTNVSFFEWMRSRLVVGSIKRELPIVQLF